MESRTIMEVTTFNINSSENPKAFAKRDEEIESDFTSKQPGFIKRQSGLDEKGNYVVVVFWNNVANAEASMNKFMGDVSVADYAKMIDASTMKMARYTIDKLFNAENSQFIEIMSFDLNPDTDKDKFKTINYKVETDFTGKRIGFMQRLIGVNEEGRQVVAVYWSNKTTSDASLQPFMNAPISIEFMKNIDQASMLMGRYNMLNVELSNNGKF